MITALQSAGEAQARLASATWILALFCALSFLIVVVSANLDYRRRHPTGKFPAGTRRVLIIRGVLGALGFFLWSYMIPGSATQTSAFATTYAAAIPVIVPFVAVVYGAPPQRRRSSGFGARSGRGRRVTADHHLGFHALSRLMR